MDYPPDDVARILLFLPGVGLVVALAVVAVMGTPLRVFWWCAAVWVGTVALTFLGNPIVGYIFAISTMGGLLVSAMVSLAVSARRAGQGATSGS